MKYTLSLLVIGLFFLLQPKEVWGQACCSGGTPLSGSLGLQQMAGGNGLLELHYDYNTQHDLIAGSKELSDNPRRRNTHSILLRGVYAFSNRISLFTIWSLVRQEEVVARQNGGQDLKRAQGIGDAVLFGQYALVENPQTSLLVGGGVKAPIGETNRVNPETGLALHPDLQPGTGAWDFLAGARFSLNHVFKDNLTFSSDLTYRLTTPGDRYQGRQKYKFGNELRWLTGFSDMYVVGSGMLEPSLLLLYRHTRPDQTNDFDTPNTGGHWIHLRPGMGYAFSPSFRLSAFAEIPVYRMLDGTQLTTTFRFRLSISYSLQGKEKNDLIFTPNVD